MIKQIFAKAIDNFLQTYNDENIRKLESNFYYRAQKFDAKVGCRTWHVAGMKLRTLGMIVNLIKITRKIDKHRHTSIYKLLFDRYIGP